MSERGHESDIRGPLRSIVDLRRQVAKLDKRVKELEKKK